MPPLEVAVHDFVPVGRSSAPEQFERGRELALACSSANRHWSTPQSTVDPSVLTLRRDRLYQYRLVPPTLPAQMTSICIPDWGHPSRADDPDHFRLKDLRDFQSTDFQFSLMPLRTTEDEPSRHGKRIHENNITVNEPAKRPRLENTCISSLISQPHFIPAPAANFLPVDTSKIPLYHKVQPLPLAPYDSAAVLQLLACKFRRLAWLIPLRGSLPWEGTSTAALLDDTQPPSRSPSPYLPTPAARPAQIMWTPFAIQHLWAFLGSIRQAKHLGPLSLSFHAASEVVLSTNDSLSEPVWESNHPCFTQHSEHLTRFSFSDVFEAELTKARLESVDYIKVYHDVSYSLSLRNVLDAYRFVQANERVPGRSGANDRKIRILKGARLVCMDERSKPAFMM